MKRHLIQLLLAVPVICSIILCGCNSNAHKNRIIPVETPTRPAGQKDVLGLRLPPIDTIRVGFIGLGMRGEDAVYRYTNLPGVEIKALCDLHQERADSCQRFLRAAGMPEADTYAGSEDAWKAVCERPDINLIYICTDWIDHAPMMLYAMEHGKNVACEVPAALTMQEIWDVINMAERTQLHCMMLENCVYDFFEMTTLNMAQHGVFGELMHVEGGYLHCLEPYWPEYDDDWRMKYNKAHRGDVYPTHGMGPACQLLNIHRGDRMKTLVSMDTKAVALPEYLKEARDDTTNVANGDHTMTMVRTELGKSMLIQHCTATPRPYSRLYELTGTKGFAQKYPRPGYSINSHSFVNDAVRDSLTQAYRSPILTADLEENARRVGGHGGMDFIMDYRLVYCLHHGLPLDMDVYDLAEWCCISPLSALSLENDFAPVEVPDFTRGNWNKVQGFRYAFE